MRYHTLPRADSPALLAEGMLPAPYARRQNMADVFGFVWIVLVKEARISARAD